MDFRKHSLNLAIKEIENMYPPDDLITCYKDFLRNRDYFQYYKYNEKVFYSLINLTIDLWESSQRINRISLIIAINKYANNCKTKNEMPEYIVSSLVNLLKVITKYTIKIRKETIDKILSKTAYSLLDLSISEMDINVLIDNYSKSDAITNLLLKYPYKSKTIREWVIKNFDNDHLREKRAELISWIIDEDPDYKVEKSVLIDDFEHLNYLDIKRIRKYNDEVEAMKAYRRNMRDVLPELDNPFSLPQMVAPFDSIEGSKEEYIPAYMLPELKLTKRYYSFPTDMSDNQTYREYIYNYKTKKYYWQHVHIPDFNKLHKSFHSELDIFLNKTMIWSIAFSRLNVQDKFKLLKKYYSEDLYNTLFNIGKYYKNLDFLRWLLTRINS